MYPKMPHGFIGEINWWQVIKRGMLKLGCWITERGGESVIA
jgi:hypothetical protein